MSDERILRTANLILETTDYQESEIAERNNQDPKSRRERELGTKPPAKTPTS